MGVFQRSRYFRQQRDDRFDLHRVRLQADRLQEEGEGQALDVFHGHGPGLAEELVRDLLELEDAHDVGMVEGGECTRLVEETAQASRRESNRRRTVYPALPYRRLDIGTGQLTVPLAGTGLVVYQCRNPNPFAELFLD